MNNWIHQIMSNAEIVRIRGAHRIMKDRLAWNTSFGMFDTRTRPSGIYSFQYFS